jgi:hypothetical protein
MFTLLFLINRPILIFDFSRSCVKLGSLHCPAIEDVGVGLSSGTMFWVGNL